MSSNKLSNKCNIRLQGELVWDKIEEWRPVARCVLVQRFLENHPEWYSKEVVLDGNAVIVVETKGLDEDDSQLETFEVLIDFRYDVKKI